MGNFFVIDEETAKKYGIKKQEMDQIWQWYGEEELESLLNCCYDKSNFKDKLQEEMYKDAIKALNEGMMTIMDIGIFQSLDMLASCCLEDDFDLKWKPETINLNYKSVLQMLEIFEKEYDIDLTYYKEKVIEDCEYKFEKYGTKNWTIEGSGCEVIIDKDILEEIIKEENESCV